MKNKGCLCLEERKQASMKCMVELAIEQSTGPLAQDLKEGISVSLNGNIDILIGNEKRSIRNSPALAFHS
jgi:hypothetical protein